MSNRNGGRSGRHEKSAPRMSLLRPFPFHPERLKLWGIAIPKDRKEELDLSQHHTFDFILPETNDRGPLGYTVVVPSTHRTQGVNGNPASFIYARWDLPPNTDPDCLIFFYRIGRIDLRLGCPYTVEPIEGARNMIISRVKEISQLASALGPTEGFEIVATHQSRREDGFMKVSISEHSSSVLSVEYRAWNEYFLAHGGEL